MTLELKNGNCLELMKSIPDKSIDLMICDLPYGETNCKWDTIIDMEEFWKQYRRIRKHDRVACIHFCSTKFGYSLIKSWEKGFKMDMVWKKRNKTGGLQSRNRPMRNHEMVYFFYDKCPKYNRDTYHKRIKPTPKVVKNVDKASVLDERINDDNKSSVGWDIKYMDKPRVPSFEPKLQASVINEVETDIYGETKADRKKRREKDSSFTPPNPASVINEVEDKTIWGIDKDKTHPKGNGQAFDPPNPASVVDEDEPKSMFESTKVFIGKRHHQTEKPLDILEFFIKYWTDEGSTILDPTMGSGSTGVACKLLKRNFIGFELDKKIFKVAQDRIAK